MRKYDRHEAQRATNKRLNEAEAERLAPGFIARELRKAARQKGTR